LFARYSKLIKKCILFHSATSVLDTDNDTRVMMMSGLKAFRKVPGCVPHDVGDPGLFKTRYPSLFSLQCLLISAI